MSDNYEFQLASGELFWLAKAFQIRSLRLSQNPFAKFAPYQTKEVLSRAQESLKLRGYIQPLDGQKWQVDHLPAAIIRWLGTTERRIEAQVITRDGGARKANLFIETDMNMIALDEGDSYRFILFPDRPGLISALLDWMDIPATPKVDSGSYALPQPEAVIPAAWRDKKIVESVLKRAGHSSSQVKAALKWMGSLQWVATLSRLRFKDNSPMAEARCAICADRQTVWFGGRDSDPSALLSLSAISRKDLIVQLGDLSN
jgi:hypothetical protein